MFYSTLACDCTNHRVGFQLKIMSRFEIYIVIKFHNIINFTFTPTAFKV